MKRLLKISFDQALLSLTPILTWFCLSLLIDKDLINVFSITYPLQYIYYIIRSPFSTGANICQTKDKAKNAVMSGFVIGSILAISIYGLVLLNIDQYLSFMNMGDGNPLYRTFSIYAILILLIQTIFSFILSKLYYEDQNSRANRYSLIFNLLIFITAIGTAFLSRNPFAVITITCTTLTLFTLYVVVRNIQKFHFRLNLARCIKYDAPKLISETTSFFIHLFGLSNAFNFGPEYSLAITFASLITDTQWDVLESIETVAKIDISKHRFNFKKSLQNAYKLLIPILASIVIMFFSLYHFYELDFTLALIFTGLEMLDFALCPYYFIATVFLQLNWSTTKITANKAFTRLSRLACSFLPTPYCNRIGALSSTAYQLITTNYFMRKHFTVSKSGTVRKRPTRRKPSARYRYHDLPIDNE